MAALRCRLRQVIELMQKMSPVCPQGKRVDLYDGLVPELGFRCSRTGAGAFFTAYVTPTGKRRRMTLGHFPQMPLADARIQAQEARQQARAGRDPAQDARDMVGQRSKEQDDRQARNFKAMMELYISRVANGQKSGAEKTRSIRKYAIAEFGRRPRAAQPADGPRRMHFGGGG